MQKRRRFKNAEEEQVFALRAAMMCAAGEKQEEIAKELGLSQSRVSRLLEDVRKKKGWLRDHLPSLDYRRIPPPILEAANKGFLASGQLLARVRRWLPGDQLHFELRVLDEGDTFSMAAAERVVELLLRSSNVGVMWGQTLSGVISAISSLQGEPWKQENPNIQCIPLCGDPVFLMSQMEQPFSASQLAADLEQMLTGSLRPDLPSLSGVSAYIARRYIGSKSKTTVDLESALGFMRDFPGYKRIFGETHQPDQSTPMVDRLDTLLTSVGILNNSDEIEIPYTGTFIQERLAQEKEISKDELNEWIIGDLGGVLIERESEFRKSVNMLNEGWTGANLDHYRRIANAAGEDGHPGVVVIASSRQKAKMIKRIVQDGLVNQLIIDASLADGLRNL
jgi:DNA-binding transcriptional regulator LsrR (DeoR family)